MKLSQNQKVLLGCATVLAILSLVWSVLVAPWLLQLPRDFSYRAEVLSLDNFFDEASGSFSGDQRSITEYSYAATAVPRPGALTIENQFNVRTIKGEPIISLRRSYGIERSTWAHTPGVGDRDRTGYLFAPRHLRPGQSFTYWHINYNAPARMVFVNEELVAGLPVYHYETRYSGEKIDQTTNLEHLPLVPEQRGLQAEPYLELWVEPVSGWLVKYSDHTTVYYYDMATGERLSPWNRFSNTFTNQSVIRQAQAARLAKFHVLLYDVVVPWLFVIHALGCLAGAWRRRAGLAVAGLGVLMLMGTYLTVFYHRNVPSQPLTIGIARWSDVNDYDQNIAGFKAALSQAGLREGREVHYDVRTAQGDVGQQRNIIRSFIDRDVDLIYTLTTFGTLATKELVAEKPIVFSVVAYPVETGIVASLQNSGNNLVGTRNWVAVARQLTEFLKLVPRIHKLAFVYHADEPNAIEQLHEFQVEAALLGLEAIEVPVGSLEELTRELARRRSKFDSLYTACDTLMVAGGNEVTARFARAENIPSLSCLGSGVNQGHLLATFADFYELGRLAGAKAIKIFEGATPSSLETIGVARPLIRLNTTTARLLDLTLPQEVLLRVDEFVP